MVFRASAKFVRPRPSLKCWPAEAAAWSYTVAGSSTTPQPAAARSQKASMASPATHKQEPTARSAAADYSRSVSQCNLSACAVLHRQLGLTIHVQRQCNPSSCGLDVAKPARHDHLGIDKCPTLKREYLVTLLQTDMQKQTQRCQVLCTLQGAAVRYCSCACNTPVTSLGRHKLPTTGGTH